MAIYTDCGKRYLAVGHKLHLGTKTYICTKKTGSDDNCDYCAFKDENEQPCSVVACRASERVYDGTKGDKSDIYFEEKK